MAIANGQVLTAEDMIPTPTNLASLFVAGTPAGTPTAYKDGMGWVALDGGWQMAAGTSPVTPAISYNTSTIIFTLPVGLRPAKVLIFPSGAFGAVAQVTADVRIETNGDVRIFVNNGGSGSTAAVFSLTGVRFRAA